MSRTPGGRLHGSACHRALRPPGARRRGGGSRPFSALERRREASAERRCGRRDDAGATLEIERARPRRADPRRARSRRPRSRTSSCAAAMSIERAGFSEQTASTRPAARWQRESASEPITRSRSATPRRAGARSAMYAVVVASKERISIGSFGGGARRAAGRSSSAPPPRSATHSSPAPKSWTKPKGTSPSVGPVGDGEREGEERDPALRVHGAVDRVDDDVQRPAGAERPLAELLRDEDEVARRALRAARRPHPRRQRRSRSCRRRPFPPAGRARARPASAASRASPRCRRRRRGRARASRCVIRGGRAGRSSASGRSTSSSAASPRRGGHARRRPRCASRAAGRRRRTRPRRPAQPPRRDPPCSRGPRARRAGRRARRRARPARRRRGASCPAGTRPHGPGRRAAPRGARRPSAGAVESPTPIGGSASSWPRKRRWVGKISSPGSEVETSTTIIRALSGVPSSSA